MSEQSKYGNWPSQGKEIDGRLWTVASIHHAFPSQYGIACGCGERVGTDRRFTEHVIAKTIDALANQSVGGGE